MSTRRIILDTDVASLSIKNALSPALLRELLGAQIGITFVTLGELNRWALLRNWGPSKVAGLEAWLSTRPTLPYTTPSPGDGARSPLTPPGVAGRARRTIAGSLRTAWPMTCRWPRSTSRTSPTLPSTRACASSDVKIGSVPHR